jgi:hypothetical protein
MLLLQVAALSTHRLQNLRQPLRIGMGMDNGHPLPDGHQKVPTAPGTTCAGND